MASKNKREPVILPSGGKPGRQEVDRLIAKGWFKDAVRQAKICHRDEPTPEHHRLLEKAFFLRAEELQKNGMPAAAQEVASHLLDFGLTDPELTEPAAALLVAVGLATRALELQGKLASTEALERLTRQAADQAVLHPERSATTPPEIRAAAKQVREALEALTAGDEARSQELFRDVPRNSPMADWRFFARGLAAFRRGEDDDARANWDRLDPTRSASRIARSLLEVTGSLLVNGPVAPKFAGLERWALGEPLLIPLRELAQLVVQSQWPEAIKKLGSIRLAIRRVNQALAIRITETLYSPLLHESTGLSFREGSNLIRSFSKAAEPLPIDPRWNRLWALAWQSTESDLTEAESFWRRYMEDLEASTAIRPEDRPKARGLVLSRLGRQFAELAAEIDSEYGPGLGIGSPRPINEEARSTRRRAIACFEEARTLFPLHRDIHNALIEVYREGDQPTQAAEAARQLLMMFPDDLDALKYLSAYHTDRDEPAPALTMMIRARALKPLDTDLLVKEWVCRFAMSRDHALHQRWDEARAELTTAEKLSPEQSRLPQFAARKVAIEIKAGHAELAETTLLETQNSLTEPTALWLAMAIEARRLLLPQAVVDRFEKLWNDAASKRVKGETAGQLAALLMQILEAKIDYSGRDEHVKTLVAYLARTTRIQYPQEALIQVCQFLTLVNTQDDLTKKLATRGAKLFPKVHEFPLLLGTLEMKKGPTSANLHVARRQLEIAHQLSKELDQTDPKNVQTVSRLGQLLDVIKHLTRFNPLGLPFGFGRGGDVAGIPDDLAEAFGAMMGGMGFDDGFDDDDEYDDDEDDGDWVPGRPPTPLPAPPSAPRTPRKKTKAKSKSKKKK